MNTGINFFNNFQKLVKFLLISLILISFFSCDGNDETDSTMGEVDSLFMNPLLPSGADPWGFQFKDTYYVTHTTGNSIILYETKNMTKLGIAQPKVIWTPPSLGMNSKNIWAPEIHRFEHKWYIYYAADNGENANHRMWVLENESENPFLGDWTDKGRIELQNDKWAIDGSPFVWNDNYYFIWSGWEGDINVRQDIYITKMESPTKAIGNRIMLLKPELAWETNATDPTVVEGPQYISRDNKMFIIYSAGGCWTDDYALGMLSADLSNDPMDNTSWEKFPTPVFVKNISGNAFGPGHNAFFKSVDGSEDWIIYHANPQSGQGCGENRSIRIQKFSWNHSGFPEFGIPKALSQKLTKPGGEY